ncbi:DUF397 domain-containing protein [Nocardia sp. NBC_00511]|uniref:DUF397 domain-containing protein n=1 Tax=Nocardia sp. NBC_00511 TaxID=2903591 RepID=UPI0030E55341
MTIDLTGAHWFKASYSGGSNECVEIAWIATDHVGVRDSKDPTGSAIVFTSNEWNTFTLGINSGEFNSPS